jgi:hypothetical protein
MHDRHLLPTFIGVLVILAALVAGAYATRTFDEVYFGPICRRYADATQMEFVKVAGGYRREPLYCVFNQYEDNGQLRAQVDVPLSRMKKSAFEQLFGLLRWLISIGLILPTVWLARRLVRRYA